MDGSERWRARKDAREDLARVLVEHARKKGDYRYTQREAEQYAASRADIVDRRRDDK